MSIIVLSVLVLIGEIKGYFTGFTIFIQPPVLLPACVRIRIEMILCYIYILFSHIPAIGYTEAIARKFVDLFIKSGSKVSFALIGIEHIPTSPVQPEIIGPELIDQLRRIGIQPHDTSPVILVLRRPRQQIAIRSQSNLLKVHFLRQYLSVYKRTIQTISIHRSERR